MSSETTADHATARAGSDAVPMADRTDNADREAAP